MSLFVNGLGDGLTINMSFEKKSSYLRRSISEFLLVGDILNV